MTSPVLEATRPMTQPADPLWVAMPVPGGRLPEVERGLALLSAPSRGWMADFLGMVTGLVTRDGLQARYEAWQDAQAFADLPAQVRTLGELRAAFERFQDHCSVDDHIVAQQVYPDIDAALMRLREQMARAQG